MPTGSSRRGLDIKTLAEEFAEFLYTKTISDYFYLTRRKFKMWCKEQKLEVNVRSKQIWKKVLEEVLKYFIVEEITRSSNHLVWVLRKRKHG